MPRKKGSGLRREEEFPCTNGKEGHLRAWREDHFRTQESERNFRNTIVLRQEKDFAMKKSPLGLNSNNYRCLGA